MEVMHERNAHNFPIPLFMEWIYVQFLCIQQELNPRVRQL